MTEKKPLLIILFSFLVLVAIGGVGAFYWSYTNFKNLESTCTKDTVQRNNNTVATAESSTMKDFLQNFKADSENKDSKIELNYLEGATIKGITEYRETVGDDEILSSVLSGTVVLDNLEISFQLGLDGIGGECETVKCINFTNNQGLKFSGENGASGCTVALPGKQYANSVFSISNKTVCDDETKLIEIFSKLKSL